MVDIRTQLDRTSLLLRSDDKTFDVWFILDKSPRFEQYEKSVGGFITFFQQELYRNNIRRTSDGFQVYSGNDIWLQYKTKDFLLLLLRPLHHCAWRDDMLTIRSNLESTSATSLADRLIPSATTALDISMVPEDWRDLVEDEIRKGLDLRRFKTLADLEQFIDNSLFKESLSESPPSPIPTEMTLVQEEREEIARTLRLEVSEFTTKSEALALYEERRRG